MPGKLNVLTGKFDPLNFLLTFHFKVSPFNCDRGSSSTPQKRGGGGIYLPFSPHQIFWSISLLELEIIPVVFYLLLQEVKTLLGQGLTHKLDLR